MSENHFTLAQELGALLSKKRWVITTAESCTAGGIAEAITAVAGASEWFHAGFVCYSNDMKTHLLGVKDATLQAHGAVSEAVVNEMLQGALNKSNSQCAIAVSGIAGPSGGSVDKPVGTVVVGVADSECTNITVHHFGGNRASVRSQAIEKSLEAAIALLQTAYK